MTRALRLNPTAVSMPFTSSEEPGAMPMRANSGPAIRFCSACPSPMRLENV